MNTIYGPAIFEKGKALDHHEVLFSFLTKRLARKPESRRTKASMFALLEKYTHLSKCVANRYLWSVMSIAMRWESIARYGCAFENCPEKTELLELAEKRRKGIRDPLAEERLFRWGAECKHCPT